MYELAADRNKCTTHHPSFALPDGEIVIDVRQAKETTQFAGNFLRPILASVGSCLLEEIVAPVITPKPELWLGAKLLDGISGMIRDSNNLKHHRIAAIYKNPRGAADSVTQKFPSHAES